MTPDCPVETGSILPLGLTTSSGAGRGGVVSVCTGRGVSTGSAGTGRGGVSAGGRIGSGVSAGCSGVVGRPGPARGCSGGVICPPAPEPSVQATI